MKKFVIVLAILVGFGLYGPDLMEVFKKSSSPLAQESARKLCVSMEEKNEEMKKMVHAALFLEKNIMARKEAVEKLEENFKKLEGGEELIKEAEDLIGEIRSAKEEKVKMKWLEISHRWKEIVNIHFGVLKVLDEVLSVYPKMKEDMDSLMKSRVGDKSDLDV